MTREPALPAPGSAALVDIRGLRKTFPNGTAALRGIDLRIDDPGIFGVVGPDGAGKTTLLRTLIGIMRFEAERVSVLGHRLPAGAHALKQEAGYLPQTWGLYRELTIGENLRFFATTRGIPEPEFLARKRELLEITDLAAFEDRPAGVLSGGMKQKLSIACALLHHPRLLVLDEPNNGVDLVARHEIWQLLSRDRGTLVVIATNYIDEASKCDELLFLYEGRALTRGAPQAIVEQHGSRPNAYRAHGRDLADLAEALALEPWVRVARFKGSAVEIETVDLPAEEVSRRLRAHPAARGRVALVESRKPDLESALQALTQEALHLEAGHAA